MTCGVLVDNNKKICPACEAPSPAAGLRKMTNPSSGGMFSGNSVSSTNEQPSFPIGLFSCGKDSNQTFVAPAFKTNLFSQTNTPVSGTPTSSAPVFDMSIFKKSTVENSEKPPLFPSASTVQPFSLENWGSVPATPNIPVSKFTMIGIHSPASQSVGVGTESANMVLKTLDPHRDLQVGKFIVMTCGYGGFAQLGLGEEKDEADELLTQPQQKECETLEKTPQIQDKKSLRVERLVFAQKVPQIVPAESSSKRRRTGLTNDLDPAFGAPPNPAKRQKVRWPAPNVIEAKIPLRMPELDDLNIVSVEMGVMHGAILTKDGRIFVWGGNDHSNLGFEGEDAWVPTEITKHFPKGTKIRKVTCGSSHTVFLSTEGEV